MTNSNSTSRRWAAVRRSTGRVVRSFASREAARSFKRNNNSVRLFDTFNQEYVR